MCSPTSNSCRALAKGDATHQELLYARAKPAFQVCGSRTTPRTVSSSFLLPQQQEKAGDDPAALPLTRLLPRHKGRGSCRWQVK